jgi:hypothetical protein
MPQKRIRPWWFTGHNGKLCFSVRYGSAALNITEDKNALEVAKLENVVKLIETAK